MDIVEIPIGELKEYQNNPRFNDNAVKAVANSIKEFGFQQPIVIDKDKVIIVGHTRFKAAKSLHLKTVPCLIADDLSDKKVRAYRIADNRVAEFSSWDIEKLKTEKRDLEEMKFDLSGFGFDSPFAQLKPSEPENPSQNMPDVYVSEQMVNPGLRKKEEPHHSAAEQHKTSGQSLSRSEINQSSPDVPKAKTRQETHREEPILRCPHCGRIILNSKH